MHSFSVLIPVYNVETYLRECLDSLVSQSFTDFDVIAVDDGSTDDSLSILKSYEDKLNLTILKKSNEGLLLARRDAIKIATGEYCIFLDSDDKIEPNTLEELNKIVCSFKADIVLFNMFFLYGDKKIKNKPLFNTSKSSLLLENKEMVYEKILFTNRLNNMVLKCIKNALFQMDSLDYRKYSKNPMGEDLIQSLEPIFNSRTIYYLEAPFYIYRQRPASITAVTVKDLDAQYHRFNCDLTMLRLKYLEKTNISFKKGVRKIMYNHYKSLVSFYFNTYICCDKKAEKKWMSMEWEEMIIDSRFLDVRCNILLRMQVNAILKRKHAILSFFKQLRLFKAKIYGR